jgi:hypothetical protein
VVVEKDKEVKAYLKKSREISKSRERHKWPGTERS